MRFVLLVLLGACGGARARDTVADSPTLVVLERGAEPQRLLRYELVVGSKERVELTAKSIVTAALTNTTLDVIDQRTEFPTVRTRLALGVAEQRDGRSRVTRVVDSIVLDTDGTTDARARHELEADVAKRRGEVTTWWSTPSGEVIEAGNQEAPRVAVNELLKIAVQLDTVRFPDVPVGVGAAWRVSSHPRIRGIAWNRVETIRLRAVTDSEVTLETETVTTAVPQDLVVQPNATTRLTGATLRMTTKIVVPLRGLATTTYGESSGEINLSVRNRQLKITSSTTIKSVFTAKPLL